MKRKYTKSGLILIIGIILSGLVSCENETVADMQSLPELPLLDDPSPDYFDEDFPDCSDFPDYSDEDFEEVSLADFPNLYGIWKLFCISEYDIRGRHPDLNNGAFLEIKSVDDFNRIFNYRLIEGGKIRLYKLKDEKTNLLRMAMIYEFSIDKRDIYLNSENDTLCLSYGCSKFYYTRATGYSKEDSLEMNITIKDLYEPAYTTNQLSEKLEAAYLNLSTGKLDDFFDDWNKTVKQNSNEFIYKNDTVKAVYDIYKVFYNPLDVLKLGDWEWGNSLNSDCKYVAVQNKMFYYILPDINIDNISYLETKRYYIDNFRPSVNLNSDKVLYLADEYNESINIFLGSESIEAGVGGIMNPSRPKGESEKRYNFLRQYIPILHGHWGGYWHIETHPEIERLVFNYKLDKATAYFRVGYMGGEATFSKDGNKWILEDSRATWIE